MDLSFLVLCEVETGGSTHLDEKPLPQCKPSASRHDATSEEKKNCDPKLCVRVTSKVTCRIIWLALDFCMYLL